MNQCNTFTIFIYTHAEWFLHFTFQCGSNGQLSTILIIILGIDSE